MEGGRSEMQTAGLFRGVAYSGVQVLGQRTEAPSPRQLGEGAVLRKVKKSPTGYGGGNMTSATQSRRHKNRVGQRIVRHICAEGLLSRPRPSFGCLKLPPMMST